MRRVTQEEFAPLGEADRVGTELVVVHEHQPGASEALVLLVHGLGGSRYGTWGNVPAYLFRRLPHVDIGLYDYASGARRRPSGNEKMRDWVDMMADTIRESNYRQVVLVGHSMGGLVCKGAICELILSAVRTKRHGPAIDVIAGLVLLATPQIGSKWAKRFFPGSDARILRRHSDFTTEINNRFQDRVDTLHPDPGPNRFYIPTYAVLGSADIVVDEVSAGLGLTRQQRMVVRGSHTSIVKPEREDDDAFRFLVDRIGDCFGAPVTPPEPAHEGRAPAESVLESALRGLSVTVNVEGGVG